MTIRVGESWQAPNGHRRWISMPLHDLLALSFLTIVFFGPFWLLRKMVLLEAWLAAELAVLLVTSVVAAIALLRHQARLPDVSLARLRWGLWMVDVR